MGRKLTQEQKDERRRVRAEIRKAEKERKRAENRRRWRKRQWERYDRMKKRKQREKERRLMGDRPGKHMIVVMKDRKLQKRLGRASWSLAANEKYNAALEKNRNEVIFPMKYIRSSADNGYVRPVEYEILLLREDDGTAGNDDISVMRDESGKIVKREIEGNSGLVVVRRDVWYVNETFSVTGHDPTRDRFDYRRVRDELIGKDPTAETGKRIFTYLNKLVIISDDNSVVMVGCKCKEDSVRLYEALFNDVDRRFVHFGGDAGRELRLIYVNEVEESTGLQRRNIIQSRPLTKKPSP